MASGDPSACAPSMSLRSPPPRRVSSQSPTVKVAEPTRTSAATEATVWVSSASSTSSKATDPISSPVPRAMTTAIARRPGSSR